MGEATLKPKRLDPHTIMKAAKLLMMGITLDGVDGGPSLFRNL